MRCSYQAMKSIKAHLTIDNVIFNKNKGDNTNNSLQWLVTKLTDNILRMPSVELCSLSCSQNMWTVAWLR